MWRDGGDMKKKKMVFVLAVVYSLCLLRTAFAQAATWINSTPNTPDTAYSWSDPGNWQDGIVGGEGDEVTITPSQKVYIRIPDGGVTVHRMLGDGDGANAYLLGGAITLRSSGNAQARWFSAAPTYCTLLIPGDETVSPEFRNIDIRGRIVNESPAYVVAYDRNLYFHYDYFALTPGGVRTAEPVEKGELDFNGGTFTVYGPSGAAACSGVWRLVKGSPYATRVSAKHSLAVGTAVSAPGFLADGTFLKRVFDDATVELSVPAEADGEVSLSFAAMTADFTASLPRCTHQHGGYTYLLVRKSRAADSCRLEIDDYKASQKWAGTVHGGYSYDTSDNNGTIVYRKVSIEGAPISWLMHCVNIEFAGDETGITRFPESVSFTQSKALESRMIVGNGKTGIVEKVTGLLGTLKKKGEGHLSIGLGTANEAGTLAVESGTMEVCRSPSLPAEETLRIKALKISAGASFSVPAEGLEVEDFVFEPGAVLEGEGELSVLHGTALDSMALSGLVRRGTAAIRLVKDGEGEAYVSSLDADVLDVRGGTLAVGSRGREFDVPQDAWLHVDATEASTIVLTNARSGTAVHSWSDVNGNGRELRSIRQQRYPEKTSACPIYNPGSSKINGLACVDLGARQTGSSGGLVVFEPDGRISPGHDAVYDNMEAPLLRTCFFVYDSTAGGGSLMGGVGGDRAKKGIPHLFCRKIDGSSSYGLIDEPVPICSDHELSDVTYFHNIKGISNACENATADFRRDGETINPCTSYFKGGPERMGFRYPDGLKCAAFGAYGGSGTCGDFFGGLKFGEIICFERLLSDVEFNRVEAYLARKWFGIETPGYCAPTAGELSVAEGASVKVLGDEPLTVTSVSGGGTVDASLVLDQGGSIVAVVGEDGLIDTLKVTGTADISNGGTVRIEGNVRNVKGGDHILLSAGSMVGGSWSVEATSLPKNVRLGILVSDTGITLQVRRKGMAIIFR